MFGLKRRLPTYKPTPADYRRTLQSMAVALNAPKYDVYIASYMDNTCSRNQGYEMPIKVRHGVRVTDQDIAMIVALRRGVQFQPVVHSWKFVWSEG